LGMLGPRELIWHMPVFHFLQRDVNSARRRGGNQQWNVCLTMDDMCNVETSIHVRDRHMGIGGYHEWFDVDCASEQVEIPLWRETSELRCGTRAVRGHRRTDCWNSRSRKNGNSSATGGDRIYVLLEFAQSLQCRARRGTQRLVGNQNSEHSSD
jgi:hypothetical protein